VDTEEERSEMAHAGSREKEVGNVTLIYALVSRECGGAIVNEIPVAV